MREIESEINAAGVSRISAARYGLPVTGYRVARLPGRALIIAEFQCDILYRGQKDALAEFLPLDTQNWIVCHNPLQLDWLSVCPPTGTGVKVVGDDLSNTPLNQAEIYFKPEGGETYICGYPPYLGQSEMTDKEKDDLSAVFARRDISFI